MKLLIEDKKLYEEISKNARAFIDSEHNYIRISEQYLKIWSN